MTRLLVSLPCVLLLAVGHAGAQGVSDAVSASRLMGDWAQADCNQPPSHDNEFEHFTFDPDGALSQVLDAGADYQSRYRFEQVQLMDDGMIALDGVYLGNNHVQHLVIEIQDGRLRTYSNLDVTTGRALVDNGVITANGRPTSWHGRCA
jgi:hypothetical protein